MMEWMCNRSHYLFIISLVRLLFRINSNSRTMTSCHRCLQSSIWSLLLLQVLLVSNAAAECVLSDPIAIADEGLFLQHVKNVQEGTYTMKLTYTGGQAWIGIGINTDSNSKMTPANAVIGRADLGDTSQRVLYYNMFSDAEDASGVVAYSTSTLKDASFVQDSAGSVLTFTQDLSEMGATDESSWIFAVGLADNQWVGKHKVHGSFQLSLADNCVTTTVTDSPSVIPTNPPVDSSGAGQADMDGNNLSTETPTPGATETPPATSEEKEEKEEEEEEEQEEQQEEEEEEEEEQEEDAATTSQPIPADPSFVVSSANSNKGQSSGIVLNDTTHPEKTLWLAHGIILAIAWGVCAPLGIGASILRNALRSHCSGIAALSNWYSLHFYLNTLTIVLTIIGFLLGVIATQREGKEHFHDYAHHKAGLAIVILVVLQGLAGYLRPGMPQAAQPALKESAPSTTSRDGYVEKSPEELEMVLSVVSASKENSDAVPSTPTRPIFSNHGNNGSNDKPSPLPPKSMYRLAWEWTHRLGGVVLVGLAWYNCHTGIEWQVENWNESMDWTSVFWGITAGISGAMFVLAYVVRV
jgi:hypothetical protein